MSAQLHPKTEIDNSIAPFLLTQLSLIRGIGIAKSRVLSSLGLVFHHSRATLPTQFYAQLSRARSGEMLDRSSDLHPLCGETGLALEHQHAV